MMKVSEFTVNMNTHMTEKDLGNNQSFTITETIHEPRIIVPYNTCHSILQHQGEKTLELPKSFESHTILQFRNIFT